MTTEHPISYETDRRGVTIRLPNMTGLDGEVPFSTEGFTEWERQEAGRLWRDAERYSREVIDCGYTWFRRLREEIANGDAGWTVDGGGSSQPVYIATQLAVKITSLHHFLNGVKHRQAIDKMQRERWGKEDVER